MILCYIILAIISPIEYIYTADILFFKFIRLLSKILIFMILHVLVILAIFQ